MQQTLPVCTIIIYTVSSEYQTVQHNNVPVLGNAEVLKL
jgi:hypothetical protein